MPFISLADACRQLAIDGKTLRRWLAQAQLPTEGHPSDARKKGLSVDHVHLLARAHRRSLPALPEERPAPAAPAPESSPLPAELLELLQQLHALPAQLVALQEQVAALKERLEQPPATFGQVHQVDRRVGQAQPAKAARRSPRATGTAPKRPKPAAHVLPVVESGTDGRYVVICPKQGLLPLEPDSEAWFAWLATQSSFRFVGKCGRLTAHHEWRVPRGAWRAHRHIRNHSYTLRLAPTHDLTIAVLEQAAAALQAHLS
jgi:hypothetical protein